MKFIIAKNDEVGDNWLICLTGKDQDNNNYYVTTNYIHASDLHMYSRGSKGDAELIAKLLDWYYSEPANAEHLLKIIQEHGISMSGAVRRLNAS